MEDLFEILIWAVPVWCLYPMITGDAFKEGSGYSQIRLVVGVISLFLVFGYYSD